MPRATRLAIAIFEAGKEHAEENLVRVIVCRPGPNVGRKGVIKIRDFKQAENDLAELKLLMEASESCEWGLWTNGLERFFFRRLRKRFSYEFQPHGDWPMADGTMTTPDAHAETYVRPGEENALRRAFQRCHNFIHGNEGMPKDAAFWQFLYLIFAKMWDEKNNRGAKRQFFALATEPFEDDGRMAIRARIKPLFEAVKRQYPTLFRPSDEITLSDRALSYMVVELARYNFSRSDVDAKGAAYQEIVGSNLRGDRGQYFTPRRAVDLVVRILDPKPHEIAADIACGTGGFLVATLAHQLRRFRKEYKSDPGDSTLEGILDRLQDYARDKLYGADFDPFLVRAATMNVLMAANVEGNTYGSIIQSIEPHHIAGLSVPRLGDTLEKEVHNLINRANDLRSMASEKLLVARAFVREEFGVPPHVASGTRHNQWSGIGVSSLAVCKSGRMDALFHNPRSNDLDRWFAGHHAEKFALGEIADIFDVPLFKHIYVKSTDGVPFFTSADLFLLDRRTDKYLSRVQLKTLDKYILKLNCVLIARSGQLNGNIGLAQYVDSGLAGATTSDHVIRLVSNNSDFLPGFIYAYLTMPEWRFSMIQRTATGASIPALWPQYLQDIPVLKPSRSINRTIHDTVVDALEARVQATQLEDHARCQVEEMIMNLNR
jgi:hypothetical protein